MEVTSDVANPEIRESIRQALLNYVTEKGKRPSFVFRLMDDQGLVGVDFFEHYQSIKELEREIWGEFFEETIQRLHAEPVFAEYTAREKLLAFYFTLIDVLKEHEGFSRYYLRSAHYLPQPSFLKLSKDTYRRFIGQIIAFGKESGEVVDRFVLSDQYDEIIWFQLLFILKFWSDDDSEDSQMTDAAIEKAVNTIFDLMGRNPIDSIFDFGKFVVQNRKFRMFF
jgi:AcrR family transcriptional regulator